ncbi:multidrug efflux pump subunit AcrA (membrane-fusion protein) [Silvibacterium bohemicum]|uniref:Multidrug efflux pump subunit AcrA (Membrane-fusion protein) n=1 Tax=Silvibacterium bohemicum TaxID=1577686 RepID=A0A841K3E1_9BACT|nr:efflux RND transporter periplasmic adaptor subunit [Silvibacterium bohemicum]MBB6145148.1 multidrug efflux pump subunit AcrA (membrane-fusion protein) [Silvibacterium bohemicum]
MPEQFARHLSIGTLILMLATGCQKPEAAAPTLVEVQAVAAQQQSITEHITVDAVLNPLAQAAIAPKISAPVKRFYVQRGSKVKQGELLATLENRDLSAALVDNHGSYDAAQAEYQTATKAVVPEDTQKAKLDLAQATANLNLNEQIVQSRKHLFAEGAIPGRDLDTAQAALVQAQATYDLARQHLDAVEQISREAALKSAQGQLESAKGKYMGAEAQLDYSEVRSPVAGVVTDRPLFAGETAVAGAPLLIVMDTSSLLAKAHLPQMQAQMLKVGDTASMTVPGMDDPVDGKVTLISPALDPGSTTVEVWVTVANPNGTLRPGTTVHLAIAGKTMPHALVVPAESVINTPDGKKAVMIIAADGTAHIKPVSIGWEDHSVIQIVNGISAGDQVITKGAYALDDGTKVKVVKATESDSGKAGGSN